MCIGLPARIVSSQGSDAVAETREGARWVSLALVPEALPGDHVLLHAGLAVRMLTENEAAAIDAALQGAAAVLRGESPDAFFADLIGRTPQLPPHLSARLPQELEQ